MNKPQIRFRGFDEEWNKAKVKDVFTLGNGYTPSKANPTFWTNGTIPWFRMEDIRENGRVLSDSIQHVTPEAVKTSGLFPAGSIIVSTTATIGEHALLIADSLANQQFTVFQTVNRWATLNPEFLLYRFYDLGKWCRDNINAGGLAAVNISDLQKYDVIFPSSKEERSFLTNYFKRIDEMITEVEREISRLEKMKQASLQKMFPRPGETTPEIRFAGFTEPWTREYFNALIKTDSYKPYLAESDGGKYPIIQQGDIPIAGYSSKKPYLEFEKVIVYGDHTTSVFKPDAPFLVASDGIKLLWSDKLIGSFLCQLVKKYGPQPEGYKRHFSILGTMECLYPSEVEEQKAIGEYFRNLDSLLAAKRQKLVKLRNIKHACLDKMFVNTSDI